MRCARIFRKTCRIRTVIRVERWKLPAALLGAAGISLVVVYYRGLFETFDWQDVEFGPWTILGILATLVLIVLALEGIVKLSSWISRPNRR